MRQRLLKLAPLPLVVASATAWAVWLGWDQHRDVHPDGSVTGPYEAWQVIGLVLTLLVPLYWAASRHHVVAASLGTTAGLTLAAFYDWSDDASGLFVIGVGMITVASLATTAALSALIAATAGRKRPRQSRPTGLPSGTAHGA
ncbi:hypothetical protein [Streptomyces sp. NPDC093225]|uniref:hypothetical protein n=1 Tax=Streptomyces sp. NPDC093225 TaxID=3366034 RepID=UPI0037F4AB25